MKIEEEIKQTKFRNPHHKATLNLLYTASWLEGRNKDFFKPFGITNQQFNILRILRGQHPNKISGTEIKDRMLDRNSDVSRVVRPACRKKTGCQNPMSQRQKSGRHSHHRKRITPPQAPGQYDGSNRQQSHPPYRRRSRETQQPAG